MWRNKVIKPWVKSFLDIVEKNSTESTFVTVFPFTLIFVYSYPGGTATKNCQNWEKQKCN